MKKLCLTLLIFLPILKLFGAENEAASDSVKYRFNPIVVTGTKVAGAMRDLAGSVSVLETSEIPSAPTQTALELITKRVPGFFSTQRAIMGYGAATGAAGGISIRGVGGSPVTGVLILRDGRPDIMGMMGHPLPDAYSLDGIEKIEVVRGPASFLYGTNAMGGVINLVSKRMSGDGFRTQLKGSIGNFQTQKYLLSHGGKRGRLDYQLSGSIRKTDGHREYSSYEGDFYHTHVGYAFSPKTRIDVNANLANINLFDPGPDKTPYVDRWYDIRRSGADLSLAHNGRFGESNLKVHGNFGKHRFYDGWRSTDYTIGVMFYQNNRPWRGNITTLGFDWKQYGGEAEDSRPKSRMINYNEQKIQEYAPYLHTQQLLLQKLIASAGVRMEVHELYGQEPVPKMGLVYHLLNQTSLRISAAKGFRSPAIRELYVFPPRNEKLEPEEMWNYEVGLSQNITQKAIFQAALFRAEGKNLILLDTARRKFFNSGEFTHTGYELGLEWLPNDRIEIAANWTKLDLGNETLNAPGKKFNLFASMRIAATRLSGNLELVRNLYGGNFRMNPMNNYTVVDLYYDIPLSRLLMLNVSLTNLFDTQYQTMFGYSMPGRLIMTEMRITF